MKKYLNGPSLLSALLSFILFVAAAGAAHYWANGVFMSARVALVYVILGAVGALALLLRRIWLALFFYAGCVLGWLAGRYIGSLNGEFAPTAGLIATFFLIGVFTLLGLGLEWKFFQHHRKKVKARRERQQQEDAEREQQLLQEQAAKISPSPSAPPEGTGSARDGADTTPDAP